MAWLSGYNYRRLITIDITSGSLASGQAIPLKVAETSGGDINLEGRSLLFSTGKNDSGDLNFTFDDGNTMMGFWVESVEGTAPNRIINVWLKIPNLLNSGDTFNFYVYTNNVNATNHSDGENTFYLFDDFDGTTLDTNKWFVLYGIPAVSNSEVILDYGNEIESKGNFNYPHFLKAKFRGTQTTNLAHQGVGISTIGETVINKLTNKWNYPDCIIIVRYNNTSYPNYRFLTEDWTIDRTTTKSETNVPRDTAYHIQRLWWLSIEPDDARGQVDNDTIIQHTASVPSGPLSVHLWTRYTGYTETLYCDWVFTTPYNEHFLSILLGNWETYAKGLRRRKVIRRLLY